MKLSTLNASLEAQIRSLQSKDLKSEDLQNEIARSKAISDLSARVIDSHKTNLEKCQFMANMVEAGLVNKEQFNQLTLEGKQ